MAGRVLLSVQEALVSFGGAPLFEDLTFHILEGDKTCLVGKNGAGKSTLMNIIRGLKDSRMFPLKSDRQSVILF